MNNSFEELRIVERINNESFSPAHIILSRNLKKYYIVDSKKTGNYRDCVNRIFSTNLEFEFIKMRHLNECLEVKNLLSYKNSIFLIDTASSDIFKLNENFEFLRKIRLENSKSNFINEAKIASEKLYVSFASFLNIYDLNTMSLIINYDSFDGILLNINDNIFSLEYDRILYFDSNGKMIKSISTSIFDSTDFTQFEIDFKFYFSKKFILFSKIKQKLIIFDAD